MEHSQSTNLGKNCAPPSSVVACLILSMERRAAVVSGDTGAAVAAAAAAAMDFMLRSTTSGVSLLFGEVATASAAAFSTSLAISVALSECCL